MSLFDSQEDEILADDVATPEDKFDEAFEAAVESTIGEPVEESAQEKQQEFIAGIPLDEFKTVFEKAKQFDELQAKQQQLHDKVFGTIGQVKQELNSLKSTRSEPISPDKFKALTEYFGDEQLAQALAEDLGGLQLGGQAAEAIDFDSKIAEATTKVSREFEKKLLTIQHPDWEQLAESPEFATWQATLSDDARKTLGETWDGTVLGQAFSKFKAWKTKREESEQTKLQRLEANVAPKRSGGTTNRTSIQDYESAFNAGVKSALRT